MAYQRVSPNDFWQVTPIANLPCPFLKGIILAMILEDDTRLFDCGSVVFDARHCNADLG
jgi:hypothetical protein